MLEDSFYLNIEIVGYTEVKLMWEGNNLNANLKWVITATFSWHVLWSVYNPKESKETKTPLNPSLFEKWPYMTKSLLIGWTWHSQEVPLIIQSNPYLVLQNENYFLLLIKYVVRKTPKNLANDIYLKAGW